MQKTHRYNTSYFLKDTGKSNSGTGKSGGGAGVFLALLFLLLHTASNAQYPSWNMDSLKQVAPFAKYMRDTQRDSAFFYFDSLSSLYWKYQEPENAVLYPLNPSSEWEFCYGYLMESVSHPHKSWAHQEDILLTGTIRNHLFSGAEILSELGGHTIGSIDTLVHTGSFSFGYPARWHLMILDEYLVVFGSFNLNLLSEEGKPMDASYILNEDIHNLQFWYYFKKAE